MIRPRFALGSAVVALRWYPATSEARNSMNRIWYAGDYTVELRQWDSSGTTLLKRGRLHITRCYRDLELCRAPNAPPAMAAPAARAADASGFFGGGPWLSWGPARAARVLRFYDLLGMHDVASRFAEATWLDSAGGRESGGSAPWELRWQPRALDLPDVPAYDFAVAPAEGRAPFVFGLALDPDLGPDAADDATGYDAGRGLAYVYDGERAVGFLLRDGTGADALAGVQQFGLRRHAPSLPREAWAAQREPGVHLLRGGSDVQLVLSAAERREPGAWTLVILRAADVATLRSHADEVLAALTAR